MTNDDILELDDHYLRMREEEHRCMVQTVHDFVMEGKLPNSTYVDQRQKAFITEIKRRGLKPYNSQPGA